MNYAGSSSSCIWQGGRREEPHRFPRERANEPRFGMSYSSGVCHLRSFALHTHTHTHCLLNAKAPRENSTTDAKGLETVKITQHRKPDSSSVEKLTGRSKIEDRLRYSVSWQALAANANSRSLTSASPVWRSGWKIRERRDFWAHLKLGKRPQIKVTVVRTISIAKKCGKSRHRRRRRLRWSDDLKVSWALCFIPKESEETNKVAKLQFLT